MTELIRIYFTLILVFISTSAICQENEERKAAEAVLDQLTSNLAEMAGHGESLKAAIEANGVDNAEARQGFIQLRGSFKKIEFMVGYLDNFVYRQMNGPNMITNPNNFSEAENKQPKGLQVIEEAIFSPSEESINVTNHLDKLISLTNRTREQYSKEDKLGKQFHVIIWDAMRLQLIRTETMGLTGFDSPVAHNSLREASNSLRSNLELIGCYEVVFALRKNKGLYKKGTKLYEKAIDFLFLNGDVIKPYQTFDYLTFLTNYLHPISKWMKDAVEALDYKFPSDLKPISNQADNIYASNTLNPAYFETGSTPERIALGEILFNDSVFSSNGQRACASCHLADKGMADGLPFNFAFDGSELKRNTPSLWNVAYQSNQFWDSRVTTLEKQALVVIHNPDEMGGDLDNIVQQLKKDTIYLRMFDKAYKGYLSKHNLVHAINCFIGSLKSFDSRFDQFMRGNKKAITRQEKQGFNLFMGKAQCATCHFPPLFNGLKPPFYLESETEIIGVPEQNSQPFVIDSDSGRYTTTGLSIHKFAFKTPGLRNVELTAPYMHNGVFSTLEEVMVFYNNGGGAGHGIDLPGQTLPSDSLHLSQAEMDAVVAFMKSLTSY